MKRILVLPAIVLLWSVTATAQRLPATAFPESYDLTFEPQLSTATFKGEETIHVRLPKPVNSITVNSGQIEFQEVKIRADGSTQIPAVEFDEKNETARLTVARPITGRQADIYLRFSGVLNDNLRGFY